MAGAYLVGGKYQADSGNIHPIRVQPETVAANIGGANAVPAGNVTAGAPFARTGGGKREYGIKARSVTVKFTGAVPDGYAPNALLRIPILTDTVYDAISIGTTGTYLTQPVVVVGKNSESGR